MSNTRVKPFSRGYVLRTTARRMADSVNISIQKTLGRVAEFEGNSDKSREVLETLSILHQMKKIVEDFQTHNKELFTGD